MSETKAFILALIFIIGILAYWIRYLIKSRNSTDIKPLSIGATITSTIGVLIMAFSGGCGIFIGAEMYGDWPIVLMISGIPFAVGFILWLVSIKLKRSN